MALLSRGAAISPVHRGGQGAGIGIAVGEPANDAGEGVPLDPLQARVEEDTRAATVLVGSNDIEFSVRVQVGDRHAVGAGAGAIAGRRPPLSDTALSLFPKLFSISCNGMQRSCV